MRTFRNNFGTIRAEQLPMKQKTAGRAPAPTTDRAATATPRATTTAAAAETTAAAETAAAPSVREQAQPSLIPSRQRGERHGHSLRSRDSRGPLRRVPTCRLRRLV